MKKFLRTDKVSNAHRAALGDICIHFSILENDVERVIWALKGQPQKVGRLGTANLMIKPRLDLLRRVALAKFGTAHPGYHFFRTIADTIDNVLVPDRNHYVHGLWSRGTEKGFRRGAYVLSYFHKSPGIYKPAPVKKLVRVKNSIRATSALIERGALKFLGAPLSIAQ